MKKWIIFFCLSFLGNQALIASSVQIAEDYIFVEKKDVLHKFVRFDGPTDDFIINYFPAWENETFDVFNEVKDSEGIAIDLGGWIGTTSIWLSKHFYHVVTVEADTRSLECLKRNLVASECPNVTICDQPISGTNQQVIFGPLGINLNESISAIKEVSTNLYDYLAESITFKQVLDEYVYANEEINSRKVSFIKCDIEGGEENILEDILQFAYDNRCKVYVSFHLSWWKSKQIEEFEPLFQKFQTNCPLRSVSEYIRQDPFGSVLFVLDN